MNKQKDQLATTLPTSDLKACRFIVTGGAGFIGSACVYALNQIGHQDILIVDELDHSSKWRNLLPLRFKAYVDKHVFLEWLENNQLGLPELILHFGADSSTATQDMNHLYHNNVEYSLRLATWCINKKVKMIYASSASTYGRGDAGYSDSHQLFQQLRPGNPYGFSKLWFDRIALQRKWLEQPSGLVGLRFFNVYGPNEYHKGAQASPIPRFVEQAKTSGRIQLFRSIDPAIVDGQQKRDFIFITDVIQAILFFIEHQHLAGVYNIGTGHARSFLDLAHAVFAKLKIPSNIDWIETPPQLRSGYQSFTEANLEKLSTIGFATDSFTTLEQGINTYIDAILQGNFCLGDVLLPI